MRKAAVWKVVDGRKGAISTESKGGKFALLRGSGTEFFYSEKHVDQFKVLH